MWPYNGNGAMDDQTVLPFSNITVGNANSQQHQYAMPLASPVFGDFEPHAKLDETVSRVDQLLGRLDLGFVTTTNERKQAVIAPRQGIIGPQEGIIGDLSVDQVQDGPSLLRLLQRSSKASETASSPAHSSQPSVVTNGYVPHRQQFPHQPPFHNPGPLPSQSYFPPSIPNGMPHITQQVQVPPPGIPGHPSSDPWGTPLGNGAWSGSFWSPGNDIWSPAYCAPPPPSFEMKGQLGMLPGPYPAQQPPPTPVPANGQLAYSGAVLDGLLNQTIGLKEKAQILHPLLPHPEENHPQRMSVVTSQLKPPVVFQQHVTVPPIGLPATLDCNDVKVQISHAPDAPVNELPVDQQDKTKRSRLEVHRRPRADLQKLSVELEALFTSLQPTVEELENQHVAFSLVKNILCSRWANAEVHVFGSSANHLSIKKNNDMDVTIELGDNGITQAEIAEQMGALMEAAGMTDIRALPRARVPVCKFVVPSTGTKVDVTVNNRLARMNTQLLQDYCKIDPRLRRLVYIVKHWAKQRQVNDAYRGSLSSYCYVLMCIHLLQRRSPPILPCLQAMQPTVSRVLGDWRCEYNNQVKALVGFGSGNGESMAELVLAFFEYWAWEHDYNHHVLSVRTGGFLTKQEKGWNKRVGTERHLICIEDPFELSHDLGRNVDKFTCKTVRREFERAARLMRSDANPMKKMFTPWVDK